MRKTLLLAGAVSLALGASMGVAPISAKAATVDGPTVNWKHSMISPHKLMTRRNSKKNLCD